jgi:hypothetical protein
MWVRIKDRGEAQGPYPDQVHGCETHRARYTDTVGLGFHQALVGRTVETLGLLHRRLEEPRRKQLGGNQGGQQVATEHRDWHTLEDRHVLVDGSGTDSHGSDRLRAAPAAIGSGKQCWCHRD